MEESVQSAESVRVIVIDDEEGMREGMRRALQRQGYGVDTAEDGESALRLLRENSYCLALVDLKMPGIDASGHPFINRTEHGGGHRLGVDGGAWRPRHGASTSWPSRSRPRTCCTWWSGPCASTACSPTASST
jgi:hypothetical protein